MYSIIVAILFIIILPVYVIICLAPDQIVKKVLTLFNSVEYSGYWNSVTNLKSKRNLVIVLLLSLVLLSLFGICSAIINQYLLLNIKLADAELLIAFAIFIPIIFSVLLQLTKYGKYKSAYFPHGDEEELNNIAESLSIAYGTKKPEVQIIKSGNPTAFSVVPLGESPIIYITSGLSNYLDNAQLEAVIAHEIAHIKSGRVIDYRTIIILIYLLQAFASIYFMLLMFLSGIGGIIQISVFQLGLFTHNKIPDEFETKNSNEDFYKLLTIFLPPIVLTKFLTTLIFSYLSYQEEYYADLEAAHVIRNPKSIYNTLEKLKKFSWVNQQMPSQYKYLYFTAETYLSQNEQNYSQPTISERQSNLLNLGNTLISFHATDIQSKLICPVCANFMNEIEGVGHYGTKVKLDQCSSCGGVWFDDWELFFVANLMNIATNTQNTSSANITNSIIYCPRCRVPLDHVYKKQIPDSLIIYRCMTCDGNFLEYIELQEFVEYKKLLTQGDQKLSKVRNLLAKYDK